MVFLLQIFEIGQRFGLKVETVLYHEKSPYQVLRYEIASFIGHFSIRFEELWKSACSRRCDPSDRAGRIRLSGDDHALTYVCTSLSEERTFLSTH